MEDFNSLQEIYDYYERVFKPYQFKVFPMEECHECEYAKKEICQGGCIGFFPSQMYKDRLPSSRVD